jgi:hypothetical protein
MEYYLLVVLLVFLSLRVPVHRPRNGRRIDAPAVLLHNLERRERFNRVLEVLACDVV